MSQINCGEDLGAMFHCLQIAIDKKRKGRRIIVALEDDWTLTAVLMDSGIAIQAARSYRDATTSVFMQCTNCSISSKGFLCIACPNVLQGISKRLPKLRNRKKSGVLHHAFLAIPQGLFIRDGTLMIAFHRFDPEKISLHTVSRLMEKSTCETAFTKNTFTDAVEVMAELDIEFIPLNSIAGPALCAFNYHQRIHIASAEEQFVEMRPHPDVWSVARLDKRTSELGLFSLATHKWHLDDGLLSIKRKRQRNNTPKTEHAKCGLHRLQKHY